MAVEKPQSPKDMEIYVRFEPPDDLKGIPWDDMTLEQKRRWMEKYRFGGFHPGTYQGITGKGFDIL